MMKLPEFQNEPLTDFSDTGKRAAMQQAIEQVREELGRTYPLIIGGERVTTEKTIESYNPAVPGQVVGRAASASAEHANRAMDAAEQAFRTWRTVPARERSEYLFKAAAEMRRRKFEL